jgi:hypothetical protein
MAIDTDSGAGYVIYKGRFASVKLMGNASAFGIGNVFAFVNYYAGGITKVIFRVSKNM